MTARDWLLANGYEDVAALIDEVMASWERSGARTRRNWWDVLAGTKEGNSRTVEGVTFPVLATAQRHEGRKVSKTAIQRSRRETPPPKTYHGSSLQKR